MFEENKSLEAASLPAHSGGPLEEGAMAPNTSTESPLDPVACAAKIARLASILAEVCEAYGLDVPQDCDATIPTFRSAQGPRDPPELPELLSGVLRVG